MNARLLLCLAAFSLLYPAAQVVAAETPVRASIKVDVKQRGAEIPDSLYGIFFEEINHAGDGGLYAELIRNRSFEETLPIEGTELVGDTCRAAPRAHYLTGREKGFSVPWKWETQWPAWRLDGPSSQARLEIRTNSPVHPNNVNYLRLTAGAAGTPVRLLNEGYWGVAVRKSESYNVSFFVRFPVSKVTPRLHIGIVSTNGEVLAREKVRGNVGPDWTRLNATFRPSRTDGKALFFIETEAPVTELDVVSVMPKETFKGHGMRRDIAELLANLKPAFLRFPGGCVAEGATFANRWQWKKTIGDISERPGHWSLWGYRNTDGLGYHEFLQFAEDIGADSMFVANCGLACEFRQGDFLPEERLHEQIQDVLDALEYALGPADSKWGRMRAKAGHPAPFRLKYVEIGNENHGPRYNRYYNLFHEALKKQWPQLVYIYTGGTGNVAPGPEVKGVDLLDEHYYTDPAWMFDNHNRYDSASRTRGYDIYVGEYAVNRGVGKGNHLAALGEAAFMMGMERNGDLVKLSSYAPLLFNVNRLDWPVNLIGYDGLSSFGRSSYYVQKLFATHRPDVNLTTTIDVPPPAAGPLLAGRFGVGTWDTSAEFRDVRVEVGGKPVFGADFAANAGNWKPAIGDWQCTNGGYLQTKQLADRCMSWLEIPFTNATLKLKARKTAGREGFLISFAGTEGGYYHLNLGGWGNRTHAFERFGSGIQRVGSSRAGSIETGRWYDISIVMNGDQARAYLDGQPIGELSTSVAPRFHAIAGVDNRAGEIVLKVLNGDARAVDATLAFAGARKVRSNGHAITLSGNPVEENSISDPMRIAPAERKITAASGMTYTFPASSLTILRVKAE